LLSGSDHYFATSCRCVANYDLRSEVAMCDAGANELDQFRYRILSRLANLY
jgi:hypothetical protein